MNKKNKIFIIVLVFVLIIVVGVGLYFWYHQNMRGNIPTEAETNNLKHYSIVHSKGTISNSILKGVNSEIEHFIIFNKEGVAIEVFTRETGYDENTLQLAYKKAIDDNSTFFYDIEKKDNALLYKKRVWNGLTKNKITDMLKTEQNLFIEEL